MVPFYESNGVCVETCPENEFGNHTSGECQPCKCHFYEINIYQFNDLLAINGYRLASFPGSHAPECEH